MRDDRVPLGRGRRSIATGCLVLAGLGLLSGQALAAETIEVQGNRRIDAETVRSYFHAAPDGRFDESARDAALKSLLGTGVFENVTIEHAAGERLIVHLTETPVLDRVAFEGNKKIKDKELGAVIESKSRGPLQRAVVQADVGRIMEAYRHAGRSDVRVVPKIINRGNGRVDLVYEVDGRRTVQTGLPILDDEPMSSGEQ